jgi:hypothetical protein
VAGRTDVVVVVVVVVVVFVVVFVVLGVTMGPVRTTPFAGLERE